MSEIATVTSNPNASPNWHDVIPNIFNDPDFIHTTTRRYQVFRGGVWVGIAVAWRPAEHRNFGLNEEDLKVLVEKIHEGSLANGFVVLATITDNLPMYVGHRQAEEVWELLKEVPPRDGPFGAYWLLTDFSHLEGQAEAFRRF